MRSRRTPHYAGAVPCGSGWCPAKAGACGSTILDRTIDLPAGTAEAAAVIVDSDVFSPAELPGLDADDQMTLARRLLREGVLVPA